MPHQIAQQRRLHHRQRLLRRAAAQHLVAKVDADVREAVLVDVPLAPRRGVAPQPRAPAEQTGDPRQQNGEVERLRQEVVGSRLEALQHVVGARAGGQQHHRHELPRGPQPAHHLETVETRQHDVEQDDVELARAGAGEPAQGHLAVLLDVGGVAFRLEVQLQARGEVFLVFDDEDAAHDAFSGSSRVKVLPRPAPRLSA